MTDQLSLHHRCVSASPQISHLSLGPHPPPLAVFSQLNRLQQRDGVPLDSASQVVKVGISNLCFLHQQGAQGQEPGTALPLLSLKVQVPALVGEKPLLSHY
ncbi:hypothetical protein QQF64_009372 [Cirrhinus molitorella]|uniref:Uncharacterized protein n=1 Tax=Cirrhinus molitorella TaxID=172907 RepID=A0ABR3M1V8_9TELE